MTVGSVHSIHIGAVDVTEILKSLFAPDCLFLPREFQLFSGELSISAYCSLCVIHLEENSVGFFIFGSEAETDDDGK